MFSPDVGPCDTIEEDEVVGIVIISELVILLLLPSMFVFDPLTIVVDGATTICFSQFNTMQYNFYY